ncbi:hypothetical protein EZV73_01145 [Acidaminobacter sp. JC074]|uniref:YciI family protein n=1 Tax=Acidaminobacter sp. JC074 TaxID=2530199 RepID=UPI001F0F56AC|nr:YciI family protein [Acidaminobacter sp. JC074]MCH4886148.1 hypothetical protein [Acidaminobacter sp. JC074]
MKAGMTLYVRRDTKANEEKVAEEIFEAHLKYLYDYSKDHSLVGGGFMDRPGGMVIFEAKDIEDAHKITRKDPLIAGGYYTYELIPWELVIVSKK